MNERTIALLGKEKFNKLKNAKVLVVGLGGVGGYVVEALARAGVGTLGLCDFDTADETNLNRQILVTRNGLGRKKTDLAKERVESINPGCKIALYDLKLSSENIDKLNISSYDFVCDCIDDTKAKLELIKAGEGKIISSMGTGNKVDPFAFKIEKIEKTEGDPLARSIRKSLREEGIKNIPVLYSKEGPYTEIKDAIPSISYMPAVAGLEIAGYVIQELVK